MIFFFLSTPNGCIYISSDRLLAFFSLTFPTFSSASARGTLALKMISRPALTSLLLTRIFKSRGADHSAAPCFFQLALCHALCRFHHIFNKNSVTTGGVVDKHVCVLMIPTKPLNFRKPRIQVNYDFAIGSLIVINLFKNDL